jgi:hypothetical protein
LIGMALGTLLAAAGTALGILGALAVARALNSLLFGVGAADPISYASAATVMALAADVARRPKQANAPPPRPRARSGVHRQIQE